MLSVVNLQNGTNGPGRDKLLDTHEIRVEPHFKANTHMNAGRGLQQRGIVFVRPGHRLFYQDMPATPHGLQGHGHMQAVGCSYDNCGKSLMR